MYIDLPGMEIGFRNCCTDFKGVLITDFYSAYDSIECEQQKCLVHLIRDMNDDLLRNPYDEEFRWLVSEFGSLLRGIIATIDQHGLSDEHLHKHEADVDRFYRNLERTSHSPPNLQRTTGRGSSNTGRSSSPSCGMTAFLGTTTMPSMRSSPLLDYRAIADGMMTETRLRDYLVLLRLYQTCKYRGISFLRFLLSREKDLERFHDTGRLRYSRPSLQVYPKGFSNYPRKAPGRDGQAFLPSRLKANFSTSGHRRTQAGYRGCPTVPSPCMPTRNALDPSTLPLVPRTLESWFVVASIQDRRNQALRKRPQNPRRCEPSMSSATCPPSPETTPRW